jgi:TRAP-type C4-dicarboxylate transport system permease small subunit
VGRLVRALAKYTAVAGGLVLVALVALIVISVIGRALVKLGLSPVTGDYELVEAGMGFAIFAFLPWAHLTRGHAIVAIFTDPLGARANAWIMVLCDALMLVVAAFITWRHFLGTMDKFAYNETTLLLRMPLWWAYSSGLLGAAVFVIVAAYLLVQSILMAFSPNPPRPSQEVVH